MTDLLLVACTQKSQAEYDVQSMLLRERVRRHSTASGISLGQQPRPCSPRSRRAVLPDLRQSSFLGPAPGRSRPLTPASKPNGEFVPSKSCGSEPPKAVKTAAPVTKNPMDGANSARGQEPVASRIAPQKVTPTMPGSAPHVFVMPSSSDACRGDRSAWLLYRPASENADRPWDADISAAAQAHEFCQRSLMGGPAVVSLVSRIKNSRG